MKKKYIIFYSSIFCLLLLLLILKPIIYPKLIPTAFRLVKLIHQKENKKDCTCWSTVRVMEYHQAEMPMAYEASVVKIESMKALLSEIWKHTSDSENQIKSLDTLITPLIPNWQTPLNKLPDALEENTLKKTQKYHYHQLTEHYRYLLSIIYDISYYSHSTEEYSELSIKTLEKFALISTHLNEKLLTYSRDFAISNKHNQVQITDIQSSFQKILYELTIKPKVPKNQKQYFSFNFWLKQISNKIIENKINALKQYNSTLWKSSNIEENQAYLLSKIFETDISVGSLKTIEHKFKRSYSDIFYSLDRFLRIDTHQFTGMTNEIISKEDLAYKVIPFKQVYEKLLNKIPISLKKNGDIQAKVKFETNNQYLHTPPEIINIRYYSLDAIRDTIIHWTLINKIIKTQRTSIIDPFGLELIAERISEYYGVLFKKTKNINLSLHEAIINKNLLSIDFLQLNNIKENWNEINSIPSKPYFHEHQSIETPVLKEDDGGFFSGISTVDIDNNNTIDIIIPSDHGVDILYNDGNMNFTKKKIFDYSKNRTHSVHAIDFNNDYLLDLILMNNDFILFLEQKNNNFFKVTELPYKNNYAMCTNDIDNDLDLDFYITRIGEAKQNIQLDGKNALENILLTTASNNTIIRRKIKEIESNGFGLACGIIDINHDNKNDIVLINDFGRDELFIQKEKNIFENQAKNYHFDDAGSGMNLNFIDFNNDDYWDIYITMIDMFNKHISFELPLDKSTHSFSEYIQRTSTYIIGNQLYFGDKNKFNRHTFQIFEPGPKGWGWGATFFDYNNNGFNDIYITNGRYIPLNVQIESEKNIFMINKNNKFLFSNSLSSESTNAHNSRAISASDLNNDGKLDLSLRNYNRAIIYRNISNSDNNWIQIKLIGPKKNTFAIGSIIELKTTNTSERKIVLAENGFFSQEPYHKHFGLGKNKIQSIKITWPDQTVTTIKQPTEINKKITIFYNKSAKKAFEDTKTNKHFSIWSNFDNLNL